MATIGARDRRRLSRPRHGRPVDQDALKKAAGKAAADEVKDGMVVGLGTGSTVEHTIRELARRVADEGLDMVGIPTSDASARLAEAGGIPLTDLDAHPEVDVTIDGADEFDARFDLIKGGGGALTREKIVAKASRRMVVVADESKEVQHLGSTFALPIEVIELGKTPILRLVESLGAEARLRPSVEGGLFRTDNGNPIIDAKWPRIDDAPTLEETLDLYPGVVECGLFLGLCDAVYVARPSGVDILR